MGSLSKFKPTSQDSSAGARRHWNGTRGVVGAIEDLAELLLGEDPSRIEHLWQMMYRQHFWHGNGIVRSTAISGIDIALWDIAGKVANMPCSKLWGGPVRDYVRTYCHLGGGKMEDFYETAADDAKRFAELAQQAVADGFTAFKSMAVPPTALCTTAPFQFVRPMFGCKASALAAMSSGAVLPVAAKCSLFWIVLKKSCVVGSAGA